ncbi:MAG: hypothetical protein ACRDTC_24865 [Pseudonocardiaceae bacterium]
MASPDEDADGAGYLDLVLQDLRQIHEVVLDAIGRRTCRPQCRLGNSWLRGRWLPIKYLRAFLW